MRLTKKHRSSHSTLNMTPMIDVVFLLLIFFMTVSQISAVQKERLELPNLAGAQDQSPKRLTINISRKGRIVINGKTHSAAELVDLISSLIDKAGGKTDAVQIALRVDRRGNSKTVNQVTDILSKLDIKQSRITVEVPQ